MPKHKIDDKPTTQPVADLQHEGKSTTYNVGDIRTCRNCDQPIYRGYAAWWHKHTESTFCSGSSDFRAVPDLDEVERVRAAAPELLEALKLITAQAKSWHLYHHGSEMVRCDSLCDLIPACELAISNAEAH